MRLFFHYFSAIVIIAIYGEEVCPFLESLTPFQLLLPLIGALAVALLVRPPLIARYIKPARYQNQSLLVFALDFSLFVGTGVFLKIYNRFVHLFPLESGLKLVLIMTTLGFFLAIDMALAKEQEISVLLRQKKIDLDPDENYFPFPAKLAILAASCSVFVCGIVFLLINKDLEWLHTVGKTTTVAEAQRAILGEIIFVFAVLLAHLLNLIISFARNLRAYFHHENTVLIRATSGHLDGAVPVSTSDEFGVMAKHTNLMVRGLREKTEELQRTRDVTIMSLASLAETRDNDTGAHLLRTQRYIHSLATHLRNHADFKEGLDEDTLELLFKSAPLHDIGKVGIPDHILLKPGRLTPEEFAIMKNHVVRSAELIRAMDGISEIALNAAAQHHERFDGSGYPQGLKGEQISLHGQMIGIVDVYDAITSLRVYHKPMPPTEALQKMYEWSGAHFDPKLVQAFIKGIGIYPAGSLVRMDSDKLGIVREVLPEKILQPIVQLIYDCKRLCNIPPELVDLSASDDRIKSHESFEAWGIDQMHWAEAGA